MYDQITSGWFYWSYDRTDWGLHNDEWEDLEKTDLLVRPYPQKIAGTNPRFNWQSDERVFSLTFRTANTDGKPRLTEIYLPPRSWPKGWELVNHGSEIKQTFDSVRNILLIEPTRPGEVKIRIQSEN
jgi:hypothetical protein